MTSEYVMNTSWVELLTRVVADEVWVVRIKKTVRSVIDGQTDNTHVVRVEHSKNKDKT